MSVEEPTVLAEEQAALRRVATLVARGVPPAELFAAVTEEVVGPLPVGAAALGRYESDRTMSSVATSSRTSERFPVGGAGARRPLPTRPAWRRQ